MLLQEGQDEARRNAVTVDRGPVLVQVLQGPTGTTKKRAKRKPRGPTARVHARFARRISLFSRHSPTDHHGDSWPDGFFIVVHVVAHMVSATVRYTQVDVSPDPSRGVLMLFFPPRLHLSFLRFVTLPSQLEIQLDGILIVSVDRSVGQEK